MDKNDVGRLIRRRHPEYNNTLPHWDFLESCYEGGRSWFEGNIFRYMKEGEAEFKDRITRSYRFNHSKEVVDLVGKYIFKSKIDRNVENAPDQIVEFWKRSDKSGNAPIQKFIRQVERMSSIFGRIWIVVDNTRAVDEQDPREYAYIVKPQHVLDMSYDDYGNLNWILISETYRDDQDPILSSGRVGTRYRMWTKTSWYLIETISKTTSANSLVNSSVNASSNAEAHAIIVDSGDHNLGIVPVFSHDCIDGDNGTDSKSLYISPSLIGDIAYLDRACANYLSNLDAIIQDQTFSQLAMPAQGLMPGEEAYAKMIEAGTKRIFLFDGENGGQPFYLSPDPRQAELIITAIGKIINEIYHTVGMAGERTKQDNSIGIDNSSGVAKAYDFERVNALLTTKAAALRRAEIKMAHLVMLWNGIEEYGEDQIAEFIHYPETFDVRGIADEFSIASNLTLIEAPSEMRKEQLRVLVDKLFPRLKKELKDKMLKEIDEIEDINEMEMLTQSAGSKPTPNTGMKGNRQGENNTDSESEQND